MNQVATDDEDDEESEEGAGAHYVQLERHRHRKGTARYGNILYVGDGTFDYVSTRYACVRVGNGPVHRVFHLSNALHFLCGSIVSSTYL